MASRTSLSGACRMLLHKRHASTMRPRRAMLYMPGSNPKMLSKAGSLGVDSVCMDLEDAVALSQKLAARDNILHALSTLDFGRTEKLVRINPVGSGFEAEDIRSALSGPVLPDGIVLPKVEDQSHLRWLTEEISRLAPKGQHIRLIALIESAQALLRLGEITTSSPRLDALIFGADDYAASVGAVRTESNDEVWYARNTVLLHAKAQGLQAIDLVQINFHDEEKLVRECVRAFQMGFTGKQIIHPKQIAPVQRAFSPDEKTVAWAKRVVEAWATHQAAGKGAFTLDDQMIDMPTVKQAESVLARSAQ